MKRDVLRVRKGREGVPYCTGQKTVSTSQSFFMTGDLEVQLVLTKIGAAKISFDQ